MNSRMRAPGGPRGKAGTCDHTLTPSLPTISGQVLLQGVEGHLGCEPALCGQDLLVGYLAPQAGVV